VADTEAPPPQVQAHDPLPESNWFWRRIYIFAVTTVVTVGVWMIVQAMVTAGNGQVIVNALVKICGWLLLYGWFLATYYMIAPTGEQIVKMWQSVTAWKAGITTSITQTATGADGSQATATTSTGPVVAPPPAPPVLSQASSATGLPVYTGPPAEDIPEPHPDLPKDAPWHS
jgi:hypothetical protein